jgi:hypothetical protein
MKSKMFELGVIVSVTSDSYILRGNSTHLYEFLSFMTGDVINEPAKIPAAIDKVGPCLLRQFPQLAPDRMKSDIVSLTKLLDTERKKDVNPLISLATWLEKLSKQKMGTKYDDLVSVRPLLGC